MSKLLRQLDFKQLQLLVSLYRTRNTYTSATEMHWSQPSVSRNLGQLRDLLGDPLFVRDANRLKPTPYMDQLAAAMPRLLEELEQVLRPSEVFDPLLWTESVSLVLSHHAALCWGADLLKQLRHGAPNVSWVIDAWHRDSAQQIQEGLYLAGIHFINDRWPKSLYIERLIEDQFVLMVAEGHPLQERCAGYEDLARFTATVPRVPDWITVFDQLQEHAFASGVTLPVSLRTESMPLALSNLAQTQSYMVGSQRLAASLPGISVLDLKHSIGEELIDVGLIYQQRDRNNAKMLWLREQVKSVTGANGE